jgi:hypothetical protein
VSRLCVTKLCDDRERRASFAPAQLVELRSVSVLLFVRRRRVEELDETGMMAGVLARAIAHKVFSYSVSRARGLCLFAVAG